MSLSRRAFIAGPLAAPAVARLPAAAEPDVLIAAQSSSIFPTGFAVWKSVDGGATWSQVNPPRRDGKLWLEGARYRVEGQLPSALHIGPETHLSGTIIAPPDDDCIRVGLGVRIEGISLRIINPPRLALAPRWRSAPSGGCLPRFSADWPRISYRTAIATYTPPVMPRAPAAETFRLPPPVESAWLAHDKR